MANTYRLILGLLLMATVACKSGPETMDIYQQLKTSLAGGKATKVDFDELFDAWEWDRVAFVRMQAYGHGAAEALGIEGWELDEFEDWVLFISGKKVTKSIKRDYDPDRAFDKTVFFDFGSETAQWIGFPRSDSRFQATLEVGGGIENIVLTR